MFRKIAVTVIVLIFWAGLRAQNTQSSADSAYLRLDSYITSYLNTVPPLPDSLSAATDRLISFAEKREIASYIASRIYSTFRNTNIMGLEGVAVHIAGKYFLSGKLDPPAGTDQMEMRIFYEFNRHSLTGMKAPELKLAGLNGDSLLLSEQFSKYNILLFFDENCTVCKKEIPLIKILADSLSGEQVKVIAVYTQQSESALRQFADSVNNSGNTTSEWIFAIDADLNSDYQRLYNVTSTPKIYLIDSEGIIQGRNLDANSLRILITSLINNESEMMTKITGFSDSFISSIDFSDTTSVQESFRYLFDRINPAANREMYRRTFSYLYESLLYSGENDKILASAILAEQFIIPYPGLWHEKSYSHEWIPSMVKRTRNNLPGNPAPDLTLFDTRGREIRLSDGESAWTLLYFFDPDCSICKPFSQELKSVYKKLRKKGVEVIAVNLNGGPKSSNRYRKSNKIPWKILSPGATGPGEILAVYEAEKVPVTYLLDSKRVIKARRINTITLEKLIP